jgi:hypothetical protein
MTTTTSIENDLEDVSEDVLGGLDSDDRATLAVKQAAAGNYSLVERLKETAPTKKYKATDLEFSDLVTDHMLTALYALYELETSVWRFFYERANGELQEANYERYPDAGWTSEPAGHHERKATECAVILSGNHLAWTRYAEEDVGVSLTEFLAHPLTADAEPRIERITHTAALVDGQILAEDLDDADDVLGWVTGETIYHENEKMTVEEYASWKYDQITADSPFFDQGGL